MGPVVNAKASAAGIILGAECLDKQLGSIELHDHQSEGVARVMKSLQKFRGALLCDEVGLGKTFTAAAVMRHCKSAVVIAPAGLAPMWKQALARSQLSAAVLSLEQFSRSAQRSHSSRLVVIDEAHHLRNRRTLRFRNVAGFIGDANVLLLSATPLHNSREDILSLLSLFLGSSAADLSPDDFATCVIRRRQVSAGVAGLPKRVHVQDESPVPSEGIRRMLIALPPPVPPRDGDECATLVQFTLLRQWASSNAALRQGLKSRIARAQALTAALDAGTLPTRKEMSCWITADLDVQLGFPALLASPGGDQTLRAVVQRHEQATRKLFDAVDQQQGADLWRADYIRDLRRTYRDRKIVAFTQFASTARALYRLVARDGKVALVTAEQCKIASGRVSRQDIISRFAPRGAGCVEPPEREAITLLIATDLCSEGLNLQDAGVVVHLDAPWTPARLEQRVGRIARTGSHHETVFVHSLHIPKVADDLLQIEARLRRKSILTQQLVGTDDDGVLHTPISIADANEQLIHLLKAWTTGANAEEYLQPVTAVTESQINCFFAVMRDDTGTYLACDVGNGITGDPRELLAAAHSLGEEDVASADPLHLSAIAHQLQAWAQQRSLAVSLNVSSSAASMKRNLARRINRAAQAIPTHRRAAASAAVDAARATISGVHSAGTELRMLDLAGRMATDTDLIQGLAEVGHSGKTKAEPVARSGFQLLVLLVGIRR